MNKPMIYLNNVAAYNEGRMIGEEVFLPLEPSKLEEIENRILSVGGGEEITVTNSNFPISEYADYKQYNELFLYAEENQQIEEALLLLKCYFSHTAKDILSRLENSSYSIIEADDEEALGYYLVENDLVEQSEDIKKIPEHYIDFEGIGRDFAISTNAQFLEGKYIYLHVQ